MQGERSERSEGGADRERSRELSARRAGTRRRGYLPCDNRAADVLYNIISRRHEQRSTIITTNLAFKSWGTIFPGAACVGALVDRFTQHCLVMDIDADSWRQKKLPTPARAPIAAARRRKRR